MTACLPLSFVGNKLSYNYFTYHLQLLLYTGTKLQHILDLLAGNMRRIRF